MSVQECFSDAASEKSHNYVPDEMKHDFLLLSPATKNQLRRNIKSDRQKLRKNYVSAQHNWRFSEAVISGTLGV